jgi:hypothetical protein
MTPRASILALTALAAASAMAIATTSASADGFLPQRPIYVPGQVVENCNGNPRLGCAVHIEPSAPTQVVENCNGDPRLGCAVHIEPSAPVLSYPIRVRVPVRVELPVSYVVRVRTHFRAVCPLSYPRHIIYY